VYTSSVIKNDPIILHFQLDCLQLMLVSQSSFPFTSLRKVLVQVFDIPIVQIVFPGSTVRLSYFFFFVTN